MDNLRHRAGERIHVGLGAESHQTFNNERTNWSSLPLRGYYRKWRRQCLKEAWQSRMVETEDPSCASAANWLEERLRESDDKSGSKHKNSQMEYVG